MKHIRKRFFIKSDTNRFDGSKFEVITLNNNVKKEDLKSKKDHIAYVETDTGLVYGGFIHQVENKNLFFPIPDPTLIYFNNAQLSIANIKKSRKKLIEKVDFTKSQDETAINEMYDYYGTTCGFVIFLFTSIESFINNLIPEDMIFEVSSTRRTEVYNKKQIQEFLDFKTKVTKVLKQATGKDFFHKATPANEMIWNLKNFRDNIIHTKPEETPLKYQELIKSSLNFKYERALDSVAKFMNYYKPDYIIECDCGADY